MAEDAELVERLRAGDEAAFVDLVDRYHTSLLRLAATFVPSSAVAEEVVQETWLGVVRGIGGFEGRSSLKTWLFRILVNRARSAGVRERRSDPVDFDQAPVVSPDQFSRDGHWTAPPEPWGDEVEERLFDRDVASRIRSYLVELPDSQRRVVVLRDVEGVPAAEVCALLGLSDSNQRVLLHRGRARLRALIADELGKA
jgi:RNA polymerase sigma-70 factor (ECF subfamily)